jgi:hypothetical protein
MMRNCVRFIPRAIRQHLVKGNANREVVLASEILQDLMIAVNKLSILCRFMYSVQFMLMRVALPVPTMR